MAAVTDSIENLEALRLDFDIFCTAVGRLPDECRKAFVLRVVYQSSYKELAEYCGKPVATLKGHVEQGLKVAQAYRQERDSLRLH